METETSNDPLIRQFKAALAKLYGPRLERVVLFGSRARGDARPDSDYDVAVFLDQISNRWAELNRLADLRIVFLDETGAFFEAKPYPSSAYFDQTSLMGEIRREGVQL